jgi:benzodiazapine receptor
MGVAAWLVWREHRARISTLALGVHILQLAFNGVWSWIFFGLHRIGLALVDLIILWILVAVTSILFWRVCRLAGIFMFPYVAWVALAGSLNYAIWILNA